MMSRASFVACNYAAALSGGFDLIVSNPPYIRSTDVAELAVEVRDHDPHRALDGGADGLNAYRGLIPQAARLLKPGGVLVVEAGMGQSGDIEGFMMAARLTIMDAPRTDLGGVARAVGSRKMPR
jgi:release factor glutamine methyltransferase